MTTLAVREATGAVRRRRVDLARHMAECDANYQRLRRLLPDIATVDERAMLLELPAGREQRLVFRIVERCPYTTDVEVTFGGVDETWAALLPAPRLRVRLYHDASSAEVLAYQDADRFREHYDYPNGAMRVPDEKIQLNRFLGEYLALCMAHGREVESFLGV